MRNIRLCELLMDTVVSIHWFFNTENFDKVYTTCVTAGQNATKALLKIDQECEQCPRGKVFVRTITLENLSDSRKAMKTLRAYQLDASSSGIKRVQGLFARCLGDSARPACAFDVPRAEELKLLNSNGLSLMIVHLVDVILDLHIAKESLSSSAKRKRAYVWLKTKPCGPRTCMLCGLECNMYKDHIFSSECSRKFARLVQDCLSEWPETTSSVVLNWLYAKMYMDTPHFSMIAQLREKAIALERAATPREVGPSA